MMLDDTFEYIGVTDSTPNGYRLEVGTVRFDGAGMRVRLRLTKDRQFVKHFDITTQLLAMALPLLRNAALLGVDR